MVKPFLSQLPKLTTRVRFPSPAPVGSSISFPTHLFTLDPLCSPARPAFVRERTDAVSYQKHIDSFYSGGCMRDKIEIKQDDAPSGGWGSVKEVSTILMR
ncbi:MAG: hypothetical protein EOO38_12010, partial [Cytophagaceae bacterium]